MSYELSLHGCGVLRFLGLPLRILRHLRLCRSSPLIAHHHRLNYFLVLRLPVSQISIHLGCPLFMVPIRIQCPASLCDPPYTKNERGGGQGRRAVPAQRGESSWSIWQGGIHSRMERVQRRMENQQCQMFLLWMNVTLTIMSLSRHHRCLLNLWFRWWFCAGDDGFGI